MNILMMNRVIEVIEVDADELDDADGEYSATKNKIFIKRELHPDNKAATLLHELIHACEHNTSIKDLKEVQVEQLAGQLLYFIRNNPDMLAYLGGGRIC